MPAELFTRIDLDKLYAPFVEKVLDVIADCKAAGYVYYATLGYRTYAEQDALYQQGRVSPGKIVTAARGGQSAHNFGLAIDFTHDLDINKVGLQPDWAAANYLYLGKMARLRGLVWGGDWHSPDMPHVQWGSYTTASSMEPLRQAWAPRQDLRDVWRVVDSL